MKAPSTWLVRGAGMELQRLLGWPFKEGDDLHPAANVEKMRSGYPLDDQDRRPWLGAIARWIDERLGKGESGIITCSDLKRRYREIAVGDRKGVTLVYLQGSERLIVDRINRRRHRYMPTSLFNSQFETLEEPTDDEHAVIVPVHRSVAGAVINLLTKVAEELESASHTELRRRYWTCHNRWRKRSIRYWTHSLSDVSSTKQSRQTGKGQWTTLKRSCGEDKANSGTRSFH